MKASATRTNDNYLPVILHANGKREILFGPPLVNKKTAIKYAQIEINSRK